MGVAHRPPLINAGVHNNTDNGTYGRNNNRARTITEDSDRTISDVSRFRETPVNRKNAEVGSGEGKKTLPFLFFSFPFSFPRAISHIYARFRVNKKDKHERRISRVRVIFTSGAERLRREARRGGRRRAGFRSRPEYRIVSGALMKSLSHDAAGGGTFYYYLIASRY